MEAMACLAHHWAGSDDVLLAKFYVLGPSMLLAGLPAGWLLGAYMRWMSRMRDKGGAAVAGRNLAHLPGRRRGGDG